MKIGILSDAHGNMQYVRKCVDQIEKQGIDKLFFLGDAVGYGSNATQTIDILRDAGAHFLLGNHEAMLLGLLPIDRRKNEVYRLNLESFPEEYQKYLNTLIPFLELTVERKRLLFVHGTPFEPLTGYLYENSDKSPYKDLQFDYIFMGHTHRPYIQKVGKMYLVNVGSCGLPRDVGNLPSFAVFDSQSSEVVLKRVTITRNEIESAAMDIHIDVRNCLFRNFFGGDLFE